MAQYWLMKSEPSVYSIDDLARDRRTAWDGVRNFQARNFMRKMKVGDLVLFYHSNVDPPAVAGIARVVREAYPDASSWNPKAHYYDPDSSPQNPRWDMVDVEFVDKLSNPVPLSTLKETAGLENMLVTKRGRLSVQPVAKGEFEIVRKLGRKR